MFNLYYAHTRHSHHQELYESFDSGRPRLTELLGLIMRSSGEDLEAVRQQLQQHVRTMGEVSGLVRRAYCYGFLLVSTYFMCLL